MYGSIENKRRHAKPRRRFHPLRWLLLFVVFVVVAAIAAAAVRLTTQPTPKLSVRRVLAKTVRVPGPAPKLAWPKTGEAAVDVEGVGSLGSSGGNTPRPIASLAKIMTAYLTLQEFPLPVGVSGFSVTVTPAEVSDARSRLALGESVVPVEVGETLTERDLLEGLLVPSANNFAVILADHDAGSQKAFVARMNAEAKKLGMRHTHYTDPSGYEDSTVSTASDQVKLAEVAIKSPTLAQIVAMPTVTLPDIIGKLKNYDTLVGKDGYIGLKTGSDSQAGGCFSFARQEKIAGRQLTVIGVVMGQGQGSTNLANIMILAINATKALANSVPGALHVETVLPAGRKVMVATSADGAKVDAVTRTPLTELGWGGMTARLRVQAVPVGSSLSKGQEVGVVTLVGPTSGPTSARTVATASSTMPRLRLTWRLRHILPRHGS